MIDKGEKTSFNERVKKSKNNIKEFFSGGKSKLRGKGSILMNLLIVLLIFGMLLQNNQMIDKMQKVLGGAEGNFHEIYDDSKVIQAYKSGNTSGLDSKDTFVLEKLTEVIDQIITDDMTDYEKEKAVYDWQVNWTRYNDEDLNPLGQSSETHTPYGVFKSHNAICVGNSTTFKLFMDAMDIPCKIIHSTESGEHAWNVVQLDGEWYHVDVTFDGGSQSAPGYAYFNVPDSIKDDGSWPWDHDEIPAANGTKYCYILLNAKECEDFYHIPEVLKDALDEEETIITITLEDKTGFTRSIADFICNSMYVENGMISYEGAYSLGGKVVYKFQIYNWNDNNVEDIPQEVSEKLSQIIESLNEDSQMNGFGDEFYGMSGATEVTEEFYGVVK